MKFVICLLASSFISMMQSCSKDNSLLNCEKIQNPILGDSLYQFSFTETRNQLEHNFKPWQPTKYLIKGKVWTNKHKFFKNDTLTTPRNKTYISKTELSKDTLLYLDYGEEKLSTTTNDMYLKQLLQTVRYSPTYLLNYFIENKNNLSISEKGITDVYSINIEKYHIELFINKKTNLIDKITSLTHDELYGDVVTVYLYSSYKKIQELNYPSKIEIKKINGQLTDSVGISNFKITQKAKKLFDTPKNYKLVNSNSTKSTKLITEKYNDFIYFINLLHTDDKVLVANFEEFILVAEAPLTSENGELIIAEVKKIAPLKPIKYFVFGHHHPHYLGGLRAFIHKEATILCTKNNKDYVEYIAKAPRSIQPDSLAISPKKIKTKIVKDSLEIGNKNKMMIYFIGDKSAHTEDYMIYYFPNEKLLFEDDLCWIQKEGSIRKAGARQIGLYNSIKELKLEVKTIIQSWPVNSKRVKTIIPFKDLEKSVGINNNRNQLTQKP